MVLVLVRFVVAALVHPSCRSFSEYVEHTDVSGPPQYILKMVVFLYLYYGVTLLIYYQISFLILRLASF